MATFGWSATDAFYFENGIILLLKCSKSFESPIRVLVLKHRGPECIPGTPPIIESF